MSQHRHPLQATFGGFVLLISIPLLWWLTHTTDKLSLSDGELLSIVCSMEIVSIVVAILVFVTGYRAVLSSRQSAVVFLGITFLGVGLLDFFQIMSYVGMPDLLSPNTPQKTMLFRMEARGVAAAALLIYIILPSNSSVSQFQRWLALILIMSSIGFLGYLNLAIPTHFPPLFLAIGEFTPVATIIGMAVVAANLISVLIIWRRKAQLEDECVMALGFAAALAGVSGLFSAISSANNQGAQLIISHAYTVGSYLYLFHATFNEALRRPLLKLKVQNNRERLVLSVAPDGVIWVHESGRILLANEAMREISGYQSDELVGEDVGIFLPPHLRAKHAYAMREFFFQPKSRAMGTLELRLLRKDGSYLPVDISLGYWQDGRDRHAIAYIRDLTERKNFEDSLRQRATTDSLTGLTNRWFFNVQLNQALAQAKRSEYRVAILVIDLDDFKTVNDSFGHSIGDELLVQVSARLRNALRENDTLARLGGDEFAVLLGDLSSLEEATTVAEKLLNCLDEPYMLKNHQVVIGGSIGIAFYPEDVDDGEGLLRYADMAMYQAKKSGRGAYACYSEQLNEDMHENMRIHIRLKDAISAGALKLFYQPQVDISTGSIIGAEALLRWNDSELGSVSPARFIPIAESSGLILPLSDWVLEVACQQISAWERAGTPLRIAVNFSAQQFRQGNLPEKVRATLARCGASPHLLEIEITESIAMTHPDLARTQLDALVNLGCSVALDDFGTGYSSLAYLKALPVTILKIDRGFIKDIPNDPNDVKISRSIIALAHSLGLQIVAEGVESATQLEFLQSHGCEMYQGWHFSKALESWQLDEMLRSVGSPN